jgi:hypothetical protein
MIPISFNFMLNDLFVWWTVLSENWEKWGLWYSYNISEEIEKKTTKFHWLKQSAYIAMFSYSAR